MKITNKQKKIVAILAIVSVITLRETGIISINLKSSSLNGSTKITRNHHNGQMATLKLEELEIPIELSDYIPLKKSKSISGNGVFSDPNGATGSYEFKYTVNVVGICSAYDLRDSLREHVLKSLNKTD
jgi:hypothetical protein